MNDACFGISELRKCQKEHLHCCSDTDSSTQLKLSTYKLFVLVKVRLSGDKHLVTVWGLVESQRKAPCFTRQIQMNIFLSSRSFFWHRCLNNSPNKHLLHFSTRFPLIEIRQFSYQDIIDASWSLWKQIGNKFLHSCVCVCVTWDICGRRLISLRLTDCGSRLLSKWQSSTPSLRAWARSQTWRHTHNVRRGARDEGPCMRRSVPVQHSHLTCALSHVTRWLSGRTRHSINHATHCRHNSIFVFWTI